MKVHPTAAGPPSGFAVRLSLVAGGERWDVEVTAAAGSTVQDLVHAVCGRDREWEYVCVGPNLDLQLHPSDPLSADHLISGSVWTVCSAGEDGGRVGAAAASSPMPSATQRPHLAICGGLSAGQRWPLEHQQVVVGRGATADISLPDRSISPRHAALRLGGVAGGAAEVADLGSLNGVSINGHRERRASVHFGQPIRLGATVVRLENPSTLRPPIKTPVVHRPPRRPVAPASTPLRVPSAPEAPAPRQRPGTMTLIVPLLFAVVAASLFSPVMAVFALMGPLMMLGSWLDDTRRHRREARQSTLALNQQRSAFEAEASAACQDAADARRLQPDAAELARRATARDPQLFERRPHHDDFLVVPIGIGAQHYDPTLDLPSRPDEVSLHWAKDSLTMPLVPITVTLTEGSVIGIVGPPRIARAIARSMVVSIAAAHGPADVQIVAPQTSSWRWTRWLPHRQLAPAVVAITDLADADRPPASSIRPEGASIVLAESAEDLPAETVTIVESVDSLGTCHIASTDGSPSQVLLAAATTEPASERCARALSPLLDPDAHVEAAMPTGAHLLRLLGLNGDHDDLETLIIDRWAASEAAITTNRAPGEVSALLGKTADGPFSIDIVSDGPHALIGGTTGSGKSELLRTLVASLAATHPPADLSFLLIDYKGGSAFDACIGLPHVTGVITDLDEGLAERALRCLTAELRRRERVMRSAAQIGGGCRLGRLVIVCDEFAALSSELPEFVDALIDVAQRGRSLGVHLVLATQRPAGVIRDNIRANTNLRIALRTQDAADSTDVVGAPDASHIDRAIPGRAIARTGPGELAPFQTAMVSQRSLVSTAAVSVQPMPGSPNVPADQAARWHDSTDLERLVDAARSAFFSSDLTAPHRPWTDPLPDNLGPAPDHGCADGAVPLGMLDDPNHQRHRTLQWVPERDHLLVVGERQSGRASCMMAVTAWLGRQATLPNVYVLTSRPSRFGDMASWNNVGAVVDLTDQERSSALIRQLQQSNSSPSTDHTLKTVLMLDGLHAESAFADLEGIERLDALATLLRNGRDAGLACVATSFGPSGLPHALSSQFSHQIVLRLSDPLDYAVAGAQPASSKSPGRGFDVQSGLECQLYEIGSAPVGPKTAPALSVLPDSIPTSALGNARSGTPLFLPVAVGEAGNPVGLTLHHRQHAVITGPPQSGKTTALSTFAATALAGGVDVIGLSPTGAPIPGVATSMFSTACLVEVADSPQTLLVLIDDADRIADVGDVDAAISRLAPHVHVIASLRSKAALGFSHFTRRLAQDQSGIALWPDAASDGDFWRTRLPNLAAMRRIPGRALAMQSGEFTACHVASSPAVESVAS